MTLLAIDNLAVTFRVGRRDVEAVRGVSFQVDEGQTVALVGESGSGKSVTALSVLQLLPYPRARHPHGSVRFRGEELVGAAPDTLRQVRGDQISMIFQEPMTSLNPLHTVEKQVNETLMLHKGLTYNQARSRTLELLKLVRLQDAEQRLKAWPHQLSGGQRQRVMIAMALANDPGLLIADEPTTALDVTIQAQILALMKDLQREVGMAILLITHDLTIVHHVADYVCVMTEGKIVEQGPTAQIYDTPQHDYTKALLGAEPKGDPPTSDASAKQVMEADNLRVWFPIRRGVLRRTVGHIKAVDGVTVSVREGQTVGVVGESGSGKTTLGMALLRLISSDGPIRFEGRPTDALSNRAVRPLRRQMQVVFQDPFSSLSPRLSVFQIIEEGLRIHDLGGDENDRRTLVANAMEEVDLDPSTMDRYPHEFSGGQRQRISIARAMVLKPRFVMLDEPTSALDMSVQAQIVDLLRRLQREHDLAYLFISHDLRVVRALANDVIVLKAGRVIEQGPAADVFDSPQTEYTKALMAAAFEIKAVESAEIAT